MRQTENISVTIPPQSGAGFKLAKGQKLIVIDPEGEQVADLVCFNASDTREYLSNGRTFDYNDTLLLSTGHILYSNRSNPMMKILKDDVGRHDFLLTPCSSEMFVKLYNMSPDHPSCFSNLVANLASFGIEPDMIPTAFNIFMNVQFQLDGSISVEPPLSRAGDLIVLEAHMDLIVGLTACSAEKSNNYQFKPIDYYISD